MCGCSQALRFLVSGLVRYSVGLGCGVVESGNGVGECRLVFLPMCATELRSPRGGFVSLPSES